MPRGEPSGLWPCSAPHAHLPAPPRLRCSSAVPIAGNRIFFAGEHTRADHPATVNGALLSGRKAATDLLASLKKVATAGAAADGDTLVQMAAVTAEREEGV